MKRLINCFLFILLSQSSFLFAQIPTMDSATPPFISKVGVGLGVNFPFGSGVLREGAYPFGLSMYINLTHTTPSGRNYELLTGLEIMADAGGGIYLALPVLINWNFKLTDFGESRFGIDGFAGLGYYFHHLFTQTEGVTIKNQHTFGIDAGLALNYTLGDRWDLNLRSGIFRSFTRPVELYYDGTSITSEDKFNYATLPIILGVSRKIGEQ